MSILGPVARPAPDILYKYYTVDRAESVLTQSKIFFSRVADFNDPFDCKFRMLFEASRLKRERFQRELVRERAPNLAGREKRKAIKRGTSRKSYEEAFQHFLGNIERSVGMFCLTEKRDNILMWSHYSDRHTGVCLGFKRTGEIMSRALQVNYSRDYPTLDYFKTVAELESNNTTVAQRAQRMWVDRIYLTKSVDWEYESEWRVVDPSHGRGLQTFPATLIATVIFGCRIKPDDQRRLTDLIRRGFAHSEIWQSRVNDDSYQLNVERV